jgi:hypothetical protein
MHGQQNIKIVWFQFALRLEFDLSLKKEKGQSFEGAGVDMETNWFSIVQLHVLELRNKLYIRARRQHYNLLKTFFSLFFVGIKLVMARSEKRYISWFK